MKQWIVDPAGVVLFLFVASPILNSSAATHFPGDGLVQREIPNEIIVAIESPDQGTESIHAIASMAWPQAIVLESILDPDVFLTTHSDNGERIQIARMELEDSISLSETANALEEMDGVQWVSPNYEYIGDPREFIPSDPLFSKQKHHRIMKNSKAWEKTKGRGIIVAATDNGFELDHSDLTESYHVNVREIPGNRRDDDNNGYVDDYVGYDFVNNRSDANPHQISASHGTHVAGIIAAQINNGKGVVGTAPAAKVMPIKFFESGKPWKSSSIARAYAYAANNGAKIISTSYNIDGFVKDRTFRSAIAYVHSKGVLHFNSAGNNDYDQPRRTRFHELILVCSTQGDSLESTLFPSWDRTPAAGATGFPDKKSSFSNYGYGIDICAPGGRGRGGGILSTVPGGDYKAYSGTSMACPNAAAAAALIWSKNPRWTRDQVAAQLLATADPIESKNSMRLSHRLGSGRVNSERAVSEKLRPPRIRGLLELIEMKKMKNVTELNVLVKNIFDPKSVNRLSNWELRGTGPDELFDTSDDTIIRMRMPNKYRIGTNVIRFTFAKLEQMRYRFTAKSSLKDPFGQKLDGHRKGTSGTSYSVEFFAKTSLGGWWD